MIIPRDMFFSTLEIFRGVYDVPLDFKTPPVVLDIGACIGAFACWANQRWPGCLVHCFEPVPASAALLEENVTDHLVNALVKAAAVTPDAKNLMYLGRNNRGEASFHNLGEQLVENVIKVATIHPEKLPTADVVKIDTEGCEMPILTGLAEIAKAQAVMVEWHGDYDRVRIDSFLAGKGFRLFTCHSPVPRRGVSKYLRAKT